MGSQPPVMTINGKCFHVFSVKESGLVCEYCGYTLSLVTIDENKSEG